MTDISDEERAYYASLRPSRIREVQAGKLAWTTVRLIDVEAGETETLRPALEHLGIRVETCRVGQVRHLFEALGLDPAPYTIVACHGDEGRIVLPQLAEELERFQPHHGRYLEPDALRDVARLDGSVVVATGCDTGDERLARAFLDCGAAAYVAPVGAPFGYASLIAPVLLFYELTEGRTIQEAVRRIQGWDGELAMWRLYT